MKIENQATIASMISLKRPAGVSRQQFDEYWANVHAPIMARMPGIWAYTLHHLEPAQLAYWRLPADVERVPGEDVAWEGVAELLYRDAAAAAQAYRLSDAPGGYTHTDAQNAFWVGLFYQSDEASRTLSDLGGQARDTAFATFRYREGVQRETAHRWIGELAERVAEQPGAQRVRVHAFRAYDNENLDPGLPVGMRHTVGPDEAVDAVLEIGTEDRIALSRVLAAVPIEDEASQLLAAVHGYRRTRRDDMVLGGSITQAGVRTPYVVRLIEQMGAISQEHPGLTDLMLTGRIA